MRKIDYRTTCNNISGQVLNLVSIISSIESKEEFRKIQNPELFNKLISISTNQSIRYSSEIEGVVVSDDRFKAITSGDKPINHNEIEILGYKEVFDYISENYKEIRIDEKTILTFHSMLMGGVKGSGQYKQVENQIVEVDELGNKRVLFVPPDEKQTPGLMEQWFIAYNEAFADSNINPLLLIPCAITDFLCIHPFNDGNGRMSRLLTMLMLLRSGYDIGKYESIDAKILEYLDAYYISLSKCNNGWYENENTYEPFIIYFLQILYKCYKTLDERFIDISLKKTKKNERIENVIYNSIVPVSKENIHDHLPDVSIRTIEVTLAKLLSEGKIIKIGKTRSARYLKNDSKH